MFIKCLKVGPFATNCYIACDTVENRAIIVDPGFDAQRIVPALEETGCTADYVVLTHGHADHMSAAHEVLEKTGARLAVFADELDLLNDPARNCHGSFSEEPFRPFSPDLFLHDGELLRFGSTELRTMHTPGHTHGSCCLIGKDSMFSGDTLFYEDAGRTDLATGSDAELEASLKRIFSLEGDLQVLPGHGDFTTLAHEREHNPLSAESRR